MDETWISREDLYAKVWVTPMMKLAEEFGISDVGLAKICRRNRIPVPGRGYWQKILCGDRVVQIPLPTKTSERFGQIRIRPTQIVIPLGEEAPEVLAQQKYEEQPENQIRVPGEVSRYSPLVEQTKRSLRETKPDERGIVTSAVGTLDVRVSRALVGRACRLLETFISECAERGITVRPSEKRRGTEVIVHGEELTVSVEETSHRKPHVRTRTEEEEAKAGRTLSIPPWDFYPTGKLVFRINRYASGFRRSWSDRTRSSVEEHLNEIMLQLVRIAIHDVRRSRLKHEQWQREWREQERREREERKRQEVLGEAMKVWRQRNELRLFLKELRAEVASAALEEAETGQVAIWLKWAEELTADLDPVSELIDGLSETEAGTLVDDP